MKTKEKLKLKIKQLHKKLDEIYADAGAGEIIIKRLEKELKELKEGKTL